jgi:hypothetical protein
MDADDVAVVKFRRVINLIKAKFIENLEINVVGNQADTRLDEVNTQFVKLHYLLTKVLNGGTANSQAEKDIIDLFTQSGGLAAASNEAKSLMKYYSRLDLCDYPYTLNIKLANTFDKKKVPGQKICDS